MTQTEPTQTPERITRVTIPALDEILGIPIKVLDDGFVRVVDYMGGDPSIVQAARVSYGAGTRKMMEDRGLIRYLMRHWHTTPFEMVVIKLHVRVPMDCWRQWIRHRTASVNEYSTRYSIAIDAMQCTDPSEWRAQAVNNKQGSDGFLPREIGDLLSYHEKALHRSAQDVYNARLASGVAREQARKDLPLSTYTEAYWKTDLHNLLGFLRLRMDGHAQKEIRDYATAIGEKIVALWCPITWAAFNDYRVHSVQLTALDVKILHALHSGLDSSGEARELAKSFGWLETREDGTLKPNRERDECEVKLARLGINVPWDGEDIPF